MRDGFYVEAEQPIGRVELIARWDGLRRRGNVAATSRLRSESAVLRKGWKEGAIPGMVKPPDDANLGFMTKFSVGTNCDGTCEAKDWAATVDKVEFAQLASAGTVEKDEKGEGTRTMIVAIGDRKDLRMAWWKTGAKHYVSCGATLEKEVAPALAAFEAACKATVTGL